MLSKLFGLAKGRSGHRSDSPKPAGEVGVQQLGHRAYVGGDSDMWDRVGRLQFDFLVQQGLEPTDILVDVACGSLRGGIYFIPYLEPGNYLGIDIEETLISIGIENELGLELKDIKRPEFVISGSFEFHKFTKKPNYGIAQSLFTHLTGDDINICLKNLRDYTEPGAKFFATFFESNNEAENPLESHPHRKFEYTIHEMQLFGERNGWKSEYIGGWGHPRGQMMMKYIAVDRA